MFTGINMFLAPLKLILAQAAGEEQEHQLYYYYYNIKRINTTFVILDYFLFKFNCTCTNNENN